MYIDFGFTALKGKLLVLVTISIATSLNFSTDQPVITSVSPLATQSWIGQTVTLTCIADGLPTPEITWKKPDGTRLKKVASTKNSVDAKMNRSQDFGNYNCEAKNIVGVAATHQVQLKQISK